VTVTGGEQARAVLGSCIGLALYHGRRKVAILAHIVLPQSQDRPGPPGKFADTAIPYMIEQLMPLGAGRAGLVAKMAGGANMFGTTGPMQIGDENFEAVTKILQDLRIPIQGEHVGGTKGRRITIDSETGEFTIEIAGDEPIVLYEDHRSCSVEEIWRLNT
jgi:chemotaxis protein CheD